jgi:hypothetical protein
MKGAGKMMIVGFDETHGETWTLSTEVAFNADPARPEYRFYGHLSDALTLNPSQRVVRITRRWDSNALRGINVVVLAHPANPGIEGNCCSGTPVFSQDELELLDTFVVNGGGLLWINEYSSDTWGTNLNRFFGRYGITCLNDTIRASRNIVDSHVLVQHFVCDDIIPHAATALVTKITYHRGCSLGLRDPAQPLVRAPEGQVVAAVSSLGKGKVAVIGDSDLFSVPYIGAYDNLGLFQGLISWLGEPVSGSNLQPDEYHTQTLRFLRDRTYTFTDNTFTDKGYNLDVGMVPGPHLVDMSRFASTDLHSLHPISLSPYTELEAFLEEAELRFQELPRRVRASVADFKRRGNEFGALFFRNLPVDPKLPDTPQDSRLPNDKQTWISEQVLAMFSRGLGDPFAYTQEKDGAIFHNICPTRQHTTALSSESSKILLDFHTETAFHPYMPGFVLLYCLRSDHAQIARTETSSTRHMLAHLPLPFALSCGII